MGQGVRMNSRNHHMFSSVGHYLLTRIAGLKQSGSGEFVAVVGDLDTSATRLSTLRGDLIFSWVRAANGLSVEVHVPVGSRAHVHFPAGIGNLVLDGAPVPQGLGVHQVSDGVQLHGEGSCGSWSSGTRVRCTRTGV